jgi:hypothetical protein
VKLSGVKTPQFRTLLLRRLKNMFPDCSARIEDAPRGITYQLFDAEGQPKTGRINIYRAHPTALTRSTIKRYTGL